MDKVDQFIKEPKKSLYKLAYPIMVGMLVQTLYNIVDTAFIGRLGSESLAALTYTFPIFFFLVALNQGIGAGTSSLIARKMGAKYFKQAENAAWHGILLSIIFAGLVFLSWPFLKPIFILMGAEGVVLDLSTSYMSIIVAGVFFFFPSSVFFNIFTGQGDTKTAMGINIAALIINIILDPIFIYYMQWGVKGAAIATVVSFGIALLLSIYLIKYKSALKVRWQNFKFSLPKVKNILYVGFPASMMMVLMSIYIVFINKFMSHYGVNYVAAFGLTSRIHSVALIPIIAFAISSMTLSGMFYGAKRYDLVRTVIFYSLRVTLIATSIIGVIFFIMPKLILSIFTNDITLLNIASNYLRVEVFAFPFMSAGIIITRSLQGMGFGLPSLMVSFVRIVLVAIPLAWYFVFIAGYSYLWIAIASVIGGMVSNIIAFIWLFAKLK